MPITKSAKKAVRQSLRKKAVNRRRKNVAKEAVKRFKVMLLEKRFEEARAFTSNLYQAVDKAAKRGRALNRNVANRTKSRLTGLLANALRATRSL